MRRVYAAMWPPQGGTYSRNIKLSVRTCISKIFDSFRSFFKFKTKIICGFVSQSFSGSMQSLKRLRSVVCRVF